MEFNVNLVLLSSVRFDHKYIHFEFNLSDPALCWPQGTQPAKKRLVNKGCILAFQNLAFFFPFNMSYVAFCLTGNDIVLTSRDPPGQKNGEQRVYFGATHLTCALVTDRFGLVLAELPIWRRLIGFCHETIAGWVKQCYYMRSKVPESKKLLRAHCLILF